MRLVGVGGNETCLTRRSERRRRRRRSSDFLQRHFSAVLHLSLCYIGGAFTPQDPPCSVQQTLPGIFHFLPCFCLTSFCYFSFVLCPLRPSLPPSLSPTFCRFFSTTSSFSSLGALVFSSSLFARFLAFADFTLCPFLSRVVSPTILVSAEEEISLHPRLRERENADQWERSFSPADQCGTLCTDVQGMSKLHPPCAYMRSRLS